MTRRSCDRARLNATIRTNGDAEAGGAFTFLLKGARRIVVRVRPVARITLWQRVRTLCNRRRRCRGCRRGSRRDDGRCRRRRIDRTNCRRRRYRRDQRRRRNYRRLDLLFGLWRRLFLFRRLFFLHVNDIQLLLDLLHRLISEAGDQCIAKESVKERDDDDRDQSARTHSILISICHAETTLLTYPIKAPTAW